MMRRMEISKEVAEDVEDRLNKGQSLLSISKEVGVGYNTLYRKYKDTINAKKGKSEINEKIVEKVKERLRRGECLATICQKMGLDYKRTYKEVQDYIKVIRKENDAEIYGLIMENGVEYAIAEKRINKQIINGTLKRLGVVVCRECKHRTQHVSKEVVEKVAKDARQVRNKVCRSYKEGCTVEEICKKYSVGRYYVGAILKSRGFILVEDFPDDCSKDIINMYKQGASITEISERLGVNRNAVRYRLMNDCKEYRDVVRKTYDAVIKRGIQSGIPVSELSRELGIRIDTLHKIVHEGEDESLKKLLGV